MAGPLERVFAQYDRIRSHSRVPAPTPLAPDPQADAGPADEPPWWSPELDNPTDGPSEPAPAVAPAPPVPRQAEAPLPPEGPSRAEELGTALLGLGGVGRAGGARAGAAEELAHAFSQIDRAANPALQRLSRSSLERRWRTGLRPCQGSALVLWARPRWEPKAWEPRAWVLRPLSEGWRPEPLTTPYIATRRPRAGSTGSPSSPARSASAWTEAPPWTLTGKKKPVERA
jgi:hypothetical protein